MNGFGGLRASFPITASIPDSVLTGAEHLRQPLVTVNSANVSPMPAAGIVFGALRN